MKLHRKALAWSACIAALVALIAVFMQGGPDHGIPALRKLSAARGAHAPVAASDEQAPETEAIAATQDQVAAAEEPGAAPFATGKTVFSKLSADNFLESILDDKRSGVTIALPGGKRAIGKVTDSRVDETGVVRLSGTVSQPYEGSFFFLRQPLPNKSGSLVGHVLFKNQDLAYRVYLSGEEQTPELREVSADSVVCRNLLPAAKIPSSHPEPGTPSYPQPPGNNSVPALESLPGAQAVVYLDFDGESGVFPGWNNDAPINAPSFNMSSASIFEVWQRVAEDYAPFNINITTSLSVYEAAPIASRMRCIITPNDAAAPGAGGVAMLSSFNWNEPNMVCWVFQDPPKACTEAISHEIGHTLGLVHDGVPNKVYYSGHGPDEPAETGWAPIMGVGYDKNLSQWSKCEYKDAVNHSGNTPGGDPEKQDDLRVITLNNNSVDYRMDASGDNYADAAVLEVGANGKVEAGKGFNEGVIEMNSDIDAFRFTMAAAGTLNLDIKPTAKGPNLDIQAEIVRENGTVVSLNNPDLSVSAKFTNLNLPVGNYFLRVAGVGRGDVLGDGYSDYGSLGGYAISGTITGAETATEFTVNENAANGAAVGTVLARVAHTGTKNYEIVSGNDDGALAIDAASGAITVADSSLLDYETLTSKWDDFSGYVLKVRISDTNDSATEHIRTVVYVKDINESPVPAEDYSVTFTRTIPQGTLIANMGASDKDRYDYLSYRIVSGDPNRLFSIDQDGNVFTAGSLTGNNSIVLVIEAKDHLQTPFTVTSTLTITTVRTSYVPAGVGLVMQPSLVLPPGPMTQQWTQISGPGTAVMEAPNELSNPTTFPVNGLYKFRCHVTNGSTYSENDDLTLLVGTEFVGQKIGAGKKGSYVKINDALYVLKGDSPGLNSGATTDGFYLLGQTFLGNFDISGQIKTSSDVARTEEERVGLIVRGGVANSPDDASFFFGFNATLANAKSMTIRRSTAGAVNTRNNLSAIARNWVRVKRVGDTLSFYVSSDGSNWGVPVTSTTMAGPVRAGMCWASGRLYTSGSATFGGVNGLFGANIAPDIKIGTQQKITKINRPGILSAAVYDDAKPVAAPYFNWTVRSGPGVIKFKDATKAITAVSVSQPGIYHLRAFADDVALKTFKDCTLTANFATPYNSWKKLHFGAQALNLGVSGDQLDPDHDNIPNLMEYAMGTDPNAANPNPAVIDAETVNDKQYLRMTVNKNPKATDITYVIEATSSLSNPEWSKSDVIIEKNTDILLIGRDREPIVVGGQRFLRLNILVK